MEKVSNAERVDGPLNSCCEKAIKERELEKSLRIIEEASRSIRIFEPTWKARVVAKC